MVIVTSQRSNSKLESVLNGYVCVCVSVCRILYGIDCSCSCCLLAMTKMCSMLVVDAGQGTHNRLNQQGSTMLILHIIIIIIFVAVPTYTCATYLCTTWNDVIENYIYADCGICSNIIKTAAAAAAAEQ